MACYTLLQFKIVWVIIVDERGIMCCMLNVLTIKLNTVYQDGVKWRGNSAQFRDNWVISEELGYISTNTPTVKSIIKIEVAYKHVKQAE